MANYYDDSEGPGAETPPNQRADTDQPADEGPPTALLPKSFFPGGCKPGDRYEVEVARVHDDELEVTFVQPEEKEGEPEEEEAPEEAPPSAPMGGGGDYE